MMLLLLEVIRYGGGPNGEGLEDYFLILQKLEYKKVAYAASFGTDYWYFSAKYSEKYVSLIRLLTQ